MRGRSRQRDIAKQRAVGTLRRSRIEQNDIGRNAAFRRLPGMHQADNFKILQLGRQQVGQTLAGERYVIDQQQRFRCGNLEGVGEGVSASVAEVFRPP